MATKHGNISHPQLFLHFLSVSLSLPLPLPIRRPSTAHGCAPPRPLSLSLSHSHFRSIEKAKLMYRSTQKGNYNLDHCWNLLRHQPKWQVHMDNLPTKRKKGCSTVTATNATDVEVCESMSINLERPLGKKAEKERETKRNRKESSPVDFDERFDARLSHMESDRKITMIERREAVSRADRDRTEIIELKKKMEMEIMSMNVDNMNAVQREYFKSLQMEIIEKRRNELNQM
ncbi:hypothetical protein F2P56_011303 [Juglans regia]|uniref:No apical meristem-associated C-terminal domain-containing protein n=1 Tax=Juglans regia TaxID=51240 RepID=A0A834CU14_JUGRE|nr:hypothetical protein F2P56_011303 [Juglans regia]